MIVVHNVQGEPLAINGDLVERVEGGNETHITLTNGVRYIVRESMDEIVQLSREDRAEVRSLAQRMLNTPVEGGLRLLRPRPKASDHNGDGPGPDAHHTGTETAGGGEDAR